MARKLRIEYPGAIYHVLNRGDRREDIFRDDPFMPSQSGVALRLPPQSKTGSGLHDAVRTRRHFGLRRQSAAATALWLPAKPFSAQPRLPRGSTMDLPPLPVPGNFGGQKDPTARFWMFLTIIFLTSSAPRALQPRPDE
jgi:hypothetical protein